MAEEYARNHATMSHDHKPCDMSGDDSFGKQGGITNGAAWYSVQGGEYLCLQYVIYLALTALITTIVIFNQDLQIFGPKLDKYE